MTTRSEIGKPRKASLALVQQRVMERDGRPLYAGTVSRTYTDNGHLKKVSLPLVRWLDSCRP